MEYQAMKELYTNPNIIIRLAYKEGSIVMNTADYIPKATRQL